MTTSSVKFCPQCGSPRVDFSSLAGGEAKCHGCGWGGSIEDLLVVPFQHDFISDEGMLVQLMQDLRKLLSGELGLPYLGFLLRWGFLKADTSNLAQTLDRKAFARYVAAIARAILLAILEERTRAATVEAQATATGGQC